MKICIVMPAYNEEKRIGKTLEEYGKFFTKLKDMNFYYQILVVINNTRDKTENIVKESSKKYGGINFLNLKPGGKGFAIIEGFKWAIEKDFDLIGFVDADMATGPEAFFDLIKNIGNSDGIIASRYNSKAKIKGLTLNRKILGIGFNLISRFFFLFPFSDTQCGAKIFRKRVIEKIAYELSITQWAFDINLLYLCKLYNFKIRELPTVWEEKEGSAVTKVRTPIQMFLAVLRLRVIHSPFRRLFEPIKFIAGLGDKLINK